MATHVQGNAAGATANATSVAVTLGAAVGVGHTVCGGVTWGGVAAALTSVTDDKLNSYNIQDALFSAGDSQSGATFWLTNISNGPTIITANFSGLESFRFIIADEYAGLTAFDGHAALIPTATTATDNLSSGNVTTVSDGDLIYGVTMLVGVTSTVTQGTGYTLEQNAALTIRCASEDKLQSVHGAVAATWTLGTAGRAYAGVLAFTQPAGGFQAAWAVPSNFVGPGRHST